MSHSASRCIVTVTAACATLAVTASGADASRHGRMHRHHRTSIGFNDPRAGAIAPVTAPASRGNVCPGAARAIDCSVWPPPFDDDPDRKATSSDGGG